MKLSIMFFCCILIGCNNLKPVPVLANDDFYEKCRQLVLSENQKGQEYSFSRKIKGIDEICILYLGDIVTAKKDTLHILNSINYSGQLSDTKRGSGNIYIYNSANKKIGHYYVGGALGVPSKIEDGSLVFSFNNKDCNQSTVISLRDSIPQEIFINCTPKGGDLYSFSTED